jgi:hypothetical protein
MGFSVDFHFTWKWLYLPGREFWAMVSSVWTFGRVNFRGPQKRSIWYLHSLCTSIYWSTFCSIWQTIQLDLQWTFYNWVTVPHWCWEIALHFDKLTLRQLHL